MVKPTSSASNASVAGSRPDWIHYGRSAQVSLKPVETQFANVSMHIIQPPSIRRIPSDVFRPCIHSRIMPIGRVSVIRITIVCVTTRETIIFVSVCQVLSVVKGGCSTGSTGVFPLRFRWKVPQSSFGLGTEFSHETGFIYGIRCGPKQPLIRPADH